MGQILWSPQKKHFSDTNIADFISFIEKKKNISLDNYDALYRWSIESGEDFWGLLWDYLNIIHSEPYTSIIDDIHKMPGAKWFSGVRMNFAENLLRFRDDGIAIIFYGEDQVKNEISYQDLYNRVAHMALLMQELGINKGDRVAGYIPNIPEAVVAITPLMTARIISPITSSITAALRITLASIVLSLFNSDKTLAVIPTLVAVRVAPIVNATKNNLDSEVKLRKLRSANKKTQ